MRSSQILRTNRMRHAGPWDAGLGFRRAPSPLATKEQRVLPLTLEKQQTGSRLDPGRPANTSEQSVAQHLKNAEPQANANDSWRTVGPAR